MAKRTIILTTLLLIAVLAACQQDDVQPAPSGPAVTQATATTVIAAAAESSIGATGDAPVETTGPEATAVVPTEMPVPTVTSTPAKVLTVCAGIEPASLYLYGDDSPTATAVRHGLYENLYTTLAYSYQPQALLKLPNLSDGDAVIRSVNVSEGDLIANPAGNVIPLLPGTQYVNADGEFEIFERADGESVPVQMQQMVVDFVFQPLIWSDGTPFTADDSVFSFALAADPATPGDKVRIDRTDSYRAADETSVRWIGRPGYLDPAYFTNIWQPLPRHQLAGRSAGDLLTAAETAVTPLSTGPYMIGEWEAGTQLTLVRNPHYYRAGAGFPLIDAVTFRFDVDLADPVAAVNSGQCDIVTQNSVRLDQVPALLADQSVTAYFAASPIFEHLDLGVNSVDYGDNLNGGRPDWFEFLPVRQAIAQCIDRQGLVDELFFGQSEVMAAYVPQQHPLFPEEASLWSYDPDGANGLLDDFGLLDTNGDGIRELVERDLQQSIVATTTFSITLGTNSESRTRLRVNERVQADLAACGIEVTLYDLPAEEWFEDGPFSPLFGRRFDLATFAWLTEIRPPCGLYLSTNITGPEEQGYGGWGNVNATGWGDEAYDASCLAAQAALPGTESYDSNHREAIRIFSERVPSVPLFQYVRTAVTSPDVANFQLDPTQPSELWNLFTLDVTE